MMPHPERAVGSHHPCLDGLPVLKAFGTSFTNKTRGDFKLMSQSPSIPLPPNPDPVLNVEITQELIDQHGILPKGTNKFLRSPGREPNLTELGIFSVMWSEHCA